MNNSFRQLFFANLRMIYRNRSGFFWNLVIPAALYVALAILPIPQVGGAVSYKNFALPGVIAYLIMQSGVYTLAYWMVDLKSRGVIKRFQVTPINQGELVISLIAARLTVILIQVILITFIGLAFFNATFAGNIIATLLLVILGGALFLTVGLLISNFANSYETAAPLTAAIGMPLAVLGNLFIPLSLLPKSLQVIGNLLPITYLVDGLRQCYLYPFSFQIVVKDIWIVATWLAILLILAIWLLRFKENS